MADRMDAPTTAQEAAEQLFDVKTECRTHQNDAKRLAVIKAAAEGLYRREWALAVEACGGPNADVRKSRAYRHPISGDAARKAARIAGEIRQANADPDPDDLEDTAAADPDWLVGFLDDVLADQPRTVLDLRVLRDIAAATAEAAKGAAITADGLRSAWQSLLSMARIEMEDELLGYGGPQRGRPAA